MEFVRTVVISLAVLSLSGEAVAMKERSHMSSAVQLLLRSQGPDKVKTATLVTSLGEVGKGLTTEDQKAYDKQKDSKSACKKGAMKLDLALKKGRRSYDNAQNDYQKTSAQVNALEASLAELKGQIQNSNKELDSLQAKLKKMRADKGLLKKSASAALRQVEAVIAKTYLRETEHRGPSSLQKKVSSLEALSNSLTFLQTDSDDDVPSDEEQPETKDESTHKSKAATPAMMLKTDKQVVVRASEATQRGFNEDEKKVIDLIETERKKLSDLEDNLADLQPAFSNKLKQAMEINRTLAAAGNGMERDMELMEVDKKKCAITEDQINKQIKQRRAVTNDVAMAAKVLEHMDTFLFLSSDLQGLKRVGPSFLQVAAESSDRQVDTEDGEVPVDTSLSLLQEAEGMGLEEIVENYGSSAVEGPFDKVTKMIGGLIASLKAQANEEVNQHQFCQDSLGKNRRDRITKKNSIDTLTSTIRWSKMAIVRLDDDLKYLGEEVTRLTDAQTAESQALTAETTRVNKEFAEHKLADEVVTKVIVILNQLCNLGGASMLQQGESLIQKQSQSSKVGSRFSQCKEASNLLKSASKGIKALDTLTKGYLKTYTDLSKKIGADAKAAQSSRNTELTSSKAARAERASELATATKDVKEAAKELKLIDDAKKELEHSCSHVETREEKMARRKDEMDALKEALNVLNGEGIPA